MNPATIAIIPLVLAVVGGYGAWYQGSRKSGDEAPDAIWIGLLLTGVSLLTFGLLAYLAGVVYFNSWGF